LAVFVSATLFLPVVLLAVGFFLDLVVLFAAFLV